MLPLAAESGQGGGTAFILPPLYEIFWAAIVLLLILLVVGRYALAERIVGEQLSDTALSERVIDRFLDELETMEPVEGLDAGASSAEATR